MLSEAMVIYRSALQRWPEAKEEFAMLYKVCSKIEMDKDAYQQIELPLEDIHQDRNYQLL